jgi:hypothetical protein
MIPIPDVEGWTGAEAAYVYVTADALNCRSEPIIDTTNILTVFRKTTQLIAFYRTGDWILIQTTNRNPAITGYCYGAHLAPCPHSPAS